MFDLPHLCTVVIQSSHCVSPRNAQIKETGLRTCILKADRVASDYQDIDLKILLVRQRNLKILPTFNFFMPTRKLWCGKQTSPKITKNSKNFKIEFERLLWARHILSWTGMYMY